MTHLIELLRHGKNYLISNLGIKAISFIAIPVYTRLLTTEEYGLVTIFLGIVGILASLMGLSFDRSISRYYFDRKSKQDFMEFTGTSLILTSIVFSVNSVLIILYAKEFSHAIGINKGLVYLLIPFTLINMIALVFQQIYSPQRKSGIVARTSLYRIYSGFAMSYLGIIFLSSEKYYSLIYGQIIAGVVLCFYWVKLIYPFVRMKFNYSHSVYIVKYSIPLIPYAISSVIIGQFGKFLLGNSISLSDAGFYSLALTIGSLVGILIEVANQTWNPYYMEYMNNHNYSKVNSEFIIIFKITTIAAFGIGIFGINLGRLMVTDEYMESMRLIPIFTVGFVFYQIAVMNFRNFGYSKKTIFMSVSVLSSGILNVILNLYLIPIVGDYGAAWAFTISYIFMAIVSWLLNYLWIKIYAIPLGPIIRILVTSLGFYLAYYFIPFANFTVASIITKFILLSLLIIVFFYNEREYLKKILLTKKTPIV